MKETEMKKKLEIPKRIEEEQEDREHTTYGGGGQDRERLDGDKKHHPTSAGQSLDGKGVQVDEYKDNPANRRPSSDDGPHPDVKAVAKEPTNPSPKTDKPEPTDASEQVDRGGFDLGGSTGKTHAGKGLGLGTDAEENRKGWGLPR